jgi:tetratricopeptide (TPR) repeat protein
LALAIIVGFVVASNDSTRLANPQVLSPPAPATVTFNRDVAPIVYKQCSSCHHPGEAVPFQLMSYKDFKKRSKQLVEVIESRFMPPWMPDSNDDVKFQDERRLTNHEIATIRAWVEQGALEGDEKDRHEPPAFNEGWPLGKPDLVVRMPKPYVVPAEGGDIYRNFVVPIGLPEGKWVSGIAMRPGGKRVVHHAFLFLDVTGETAELRDEAELEVGYAGMDPGSGVGSPAGQFVSWQPGKQDSMGPAGSPWWMPRRSDLVLQMHIRPSGKEENIQGEIGLYFTDQPAEIEPSIIMLRSVAIDIPPGVKDHVIESSYVLPVEVDVTSVLPHAHYLCRKLDAWATLPNGRRQQILSIKDWNFDWQGDYRFIEPIQLPRGSQFSMRYIYDNSEENARNPNHPPKRVTFGLNSSDEMGELWLQVVTHNKADKHALDDDYRRTYAVPDAIATARAVLRDEPTNPNRMVTLGATLLVADEVDEAVELFNDALAIHPQDAKARYHLGVAFANRNDLGLAVEQWKEALRIDPKYYRAHNSLANWYRRLGNLAKSQEHLIAAIKANENHILSRVNLAKVYADQGQWSRAEFELRNALLIEPQNGPIRQLWLDAQARAKDAVQ